MNEGIWQPDGIFSFFSTFAKIGYRKNTYYHLRPDLIKMKTSYSQCLSKIKSGLEYMTNALHKYNLIPGQKD